MIQIDYRQSQRVATVRVTMLAYVCMLVAAAAEGALVPRLTRHGFTSAAGTASRGEHIATGWSLGLPFSGVAHGGSINTPVTLYTEYWSRLIYAGLPPAPVVTVPLSLLPGQSGTYDSVLLSVPIVGTKPPIYSYDYHTWVVAWTNGVALAPCCINQTNEQSQWNLNLVLDEYDQVVLTLMSSNMFGMSAEQTVLVVQQVPEPMVALAVALVYLVAVARRKTRQG